jgi:hypothetical protein
VGKSFLLQDTYLPKGESKWQIQRWPADPANFVRKPVTMNKLKLLPVF